MSDSRRPVKRIKAQSVTDLRSSVADDRRARFIKYCIAMGIRTLCVISLFFVQGWWVPVVLGAAIVLPYLAVVVANVSGSPLASAPQRPGAIVPVTPVVIVDPQDSPPRDS
jgi:hypothetical protein